tara:strand:+ start:797 stop:1087 length:291 start_codon:yes stop_codon:yes gene_type:complete
VTVVQLHVLDRLTYVWVVLQHHNVSLHEVVVQLLSQTDCLCGCEMVGLRYHAQHVYLVEVTVHDVLVKGWVICHAIQFNELHLIVYDGLLCERTWW